MRMLKKEMEQAVKDKDEETRKELEIETERMRKEIARFEYDTRRLASDYKSEKERLEARVTQMETETRQESHRIATQYQQQVNELRNTIQANAAASERERKQMLYEMKELAKSRDLARVESEKRQESERIAIQHQRQIEDLRNVIQTNAIASERERTRMLHEMRELAKSRDLARMEFETRQESDRVITQYERQIEDLRNAIQTHAIVSERERKQMFGEMNELTRNRDFAQVESKKRQESARVVTQYQLRIDELKETMQANAAASEREKARILDDVRRLELGHNSEKDVQEKKGGSRRMGFEARWTVFGRSLDMSS